MISDRRSFLRAGSLLLAAAAVRPQLLFGQATTPGVLSFDATELKLLDFVLSYSSAVRVTGASVLGHFKPDSNCGLRLLVQVTDFVKAAEALLRAPVTRFYTKENSVSFVAQNAGYIIENLSAVDFSARMAQLGSKEHVIFAHDAMVYDPIAKEMDDPLGALAAGEIRLVNRPGKTPDSLAVAMRGTGDARSAWLPEGPDFINWKAQLVRSTVSSKAAYPVAVSFVRALPAFVALAGADETKSAVATPLISSAIKSAFGLSARQAIGEFDRVRAIFGQSYSDAGVWLYVVLGKQVRKDTRGWIEPPLLADVRWRDALDTASKIYAAFQTPELKSQA